MATSEKVQEMAMEFECRSFELLRDLCGPNDSFLHLFENAFQAGIHITKNNSFRITGKECGLVHSLLESLRTGVVTAQRIQTMIDAEKAKAFQSKPLVFKAAGHVYCSKTPDQHTYMQNLMDHRINFGTGPAGTGKTALPTAYAAQLLLDEEITRIVIVRPAMEAGEKLGFLPGNLEAKMGPFARPVIDELQEIFGAEKLDKYLETGDVEITALAYMRGRTLKNAYVIWDEFQNATVMQAKMAITRLGHNARFTFTGDPSQCDLPKHIPSGLTYLRDCLDKDELKENIAFTDMQGSVRDELLDKITPYLI